MDDVMGTVEAAGRLRMSPQRVRTLWHEGALSGRIVANRLLLDRASVLDFAERDRPATRPLSARNALTLLLVVAGESSPWASASELSRLRRLISTRDVGALATLVRARARTVHLGGVAGAGGYVLAEGGVVPAGATLAHRWTDLVVDGVTEVYATQSTTRRLTDRLHLWRDPRGPIVVHTVRDDFGGLLRDRPEMPAPVVAVDLLDSGDPRSHRAGQALWAQVVQRWRDEHTPVRPRGRGEVR
jgi:hypothetical protein